MKKKVYYISLCIISIVIFSCFLAINHTNKNTYIFNSEKTVLKEISASSNNYITTHGLRDQFDLNSILTGDNYKYNTFFFKGKIVDIKSYEVEWTDENNETWGPFLRNIIFVQPDEIYTGIFQSNKEIVRILTTESLNRTDNNSVKINIGDDYVFLNCWILDNKYFTQISQLSKNKHIYDTSLEMADVIIGGIWNSIFPVVNNNILIYNEYFSDITNITKNSLSSKNSDFDKFITNKNDFSDNYIIVNMSDFKKSINILLKNIK